MTIRSPQDGDPLTQPVTAMSVSLEDAELLRDELIGTGIDARVEKVRLAPPGDPGGAFEIAAKLAPALWTARDVLDPEVESYRFDILVAPDDLGRAAAVGERVLPGIEMASVDPPA